MEDPEPAVSSLQKEGKFPRLRVQIRKPDLSRYFTYTEGWLAGDGLRELLELCDSLEYRLYPYRGTVLKRAPKREFYRDEVGPRLPLYRWGQQKICYCWGEKMPAVLLALADRIEKEFGERVNHCLIIRYANGTDHHAPPHHDKQEGVPGTGATDIRSGTSIFDLSIGTPRTFCIEREDGSPVWSRKLQEGSMLVLTALGNRTYKHSVPKEPAVKTHRYSIIFRSVRLADSGSSH